MKFAFTAIAAAVAFTSATTAGAAGINTHETWIEWLQNDTEVDWSTPDVDPGSNGSTALNEVVEHEYHARRKDREAMIDRTQSNKGFISRVNKKVDANGGALADHEGRISENGQRIDATQERIDHTQQRVDATNQRIDVNDQRIGELGAQNRNQAEAISSNAATNDRQDSTLATHSRRISRNAITGQANADAIGDLDKRQQDQGRRISENSQGVYANAQTNKHQDEALAEQSERIAVNARTQRDYAARTEQRFDSHASAITQNSAGIAANRQSIDELRGDVSDLKAGVAAAIAASSHAWRVGPGAGFQMSLSAGHYEGESAGSLAAGGQVGDRTFLNVNISHDSRGNAGYGGAIGFQF
jgi:hypothetical protein